MQLTPLEIQHLSKNMVSFMDHNPIAAGGSLVSGTNQVQVEPGGATFSTIQAALNSIKDASEQKQYAIYVGPGVYTEAITMKPWVFIIGNGPDQTALVYPGSSDTSGLEATVIAASNSGIAGMQVRSTYAPGVIYCSGIRCDGAMNFNIANVVCSVDDDPSRPGSLMPIYNNFGGSFTGPCSVIIASTAVVANALNPQSFVTGILAVSNGTYQIFSSKITTGGNSNAVGIVANPGPGSIVTVDDSTVTGVEFCLLGSSQSSLTANRCNLNGPVGPYVTVNP